MRRFHLTATSIVFMVALFATAPSRAFAQDSTRTTPTPLEQILARIKATAQVRDSLSRIADQATGERRSVLEEQVWQEQLVIQAGIVEATDELARVKAKGGDLAGAQAYLAGATKSTWPGYRAQIERREHALLELLDRRDGATPQEQLEIENRFAQDSERAARMYRDLIDALLVAERLGIDVTVMRSYVTDKVSHMADQTRIRIVVLGRAHALALARVQRKSDDTEAQIALEASGAALDQTTQNLETEISLLGRLGRDTTSLKVALIVARGSLTNAIFEPGVFQGLFQHWWRQLMDMLATRGPHWLFEGLMVVFILGAFGLLGRLTKSVVRRGVATTSASKLLKDTIVDWSSRLVALIGFLVLLRQFGVQLGPMLAGLGIVGFALGFALQDTLANFAAGGMILAYHPYDIGDTVEVAGVQGIVRHMSLVATTILTLDNQTLIVPNRKMWGDVIRNVTSQHERRVDLTIAVGYENDVATVERLLSEIANTDARVLKRPAPVIKLHQLADASLQFVVRVWTTQENYWDVYWDLTRAVKLRFDKEGIRFPVPQRDVRVIPQAAAPGTEASAP